jgi:site-specific recombinase XerC
VNANAAEHTEGPTHSKSVWVKTPVANLLRYKPSGTYFARVRIRGKLFRQALNTNVISVAKLRLSDFIKEKRDEMGDDSAVITGKMTVTDALDIYRQRLEAQQDISEGAKVYRRKCIDALLKSWTGLEALPITHHDLRHLFATRAIESEVDIPTVSRWLGHKDGGALAMKVYGHLRDQHSTEMAEKVRFSTGTTS